jgi:hypothetical protein
MSNRSNAMCPALPKESGRPSTHSSVIRLLSTSSGVSVLSWAAAFVVAEPGGSSHAPFIAMALLAGALGCSCLIFLICRATMARLMTSLRDIRGTHFQ